MPGKQSIRPATIDDHQAIVVIATPLQETHAQGQPRRFRAGGRPFPETYVRELLNSPLNEILVSERDGVVTGFMILKIQDTPPIDILQPRRYVLVDTIAVAPAYQRRGIGRALIEAAVAWGRNYGAQDLELGVAAFNTAAIAFYERLGFAQTNLKMSRSIDGGTEIQRGEQ